MAIASSWIHGNALQVERPVIRDPQGVETGWLRLTPSGVGAQVVNEGNPVQSWMHLPIPTVKEPLEWGEQFRLRRVVLLLECSDASIDQVNVYDGNQLLQGFYSIKLQGTYLTAGPDNTFELTPPRSVWTGVGLSFLFNPYIRVDPAKEENITLHVAAAGAYFETISSLYAKFLPYTPFRRRGPGG
jgi:hypothetical protein